MRRLNERVRTISQYGSLAENLSEEMVLTDLQTLEFPLGFIRLKKQFLRQAEMRPFVGRYFGEEEGKENPGEEDNEREVYLTEYGSVYHTLADCAHLKLSITQTTYDNMLILRNRSGERYRGCEFCVENKTIQSDERVYITEEGNRYHIMINCSGLLRRITCGTLAEAIDRGRRLCSKCAAAEEKKGEADAGNDRSVVGVVGLGRSAA